MNKINIILIVNLGYILGILIGLYFKKVIALFLCGIILIYIIVRKNKYTRRYVKLLLPTKLFVIFMVACFISSCVILIKENSFSDFIKNNKNIQLEAIVKSYPENTENSKKYMIEYKNKRFILYTPKEIELEYGDIILITGVFQKVKSYKNPGVFNFAQSLKKKNVYGTIKMQKYKKIGHKLSWYKIFAQLNYKLKNKIKKYFDKQTSSILTALLLGDKSQVDDDIKESIQENGLSHIFAISGMHISCIVLLLQNSLNMITEDKRKKRYMVIITLILYGMIIGFLASAVRAIIMITMAILAKLFHRKNNNLIEMSIASLIILIYNPYYLIDAGFILSFVATAGIIYIYPKIKKDKINSKIIRYFGDIFIVGIAVNIAIFPISIYVFKRISISYLVTGFILVPLVFALEIIGIVILFLPNFLIQLMLPVINFLVTVFLKLSQINLGKFYLKVPIISEIIIYYLVLFLILNKKSRIILKNIIKKVIYFLLILSIIITLKPYIFRQLRVYFVDVGQGDCTLIKTPQNKTILLDGGGDEQYDIGSNVLIPYLLNKRISSIDYVIISHFDTDHVRTE